MTDEKRINAVKGSKPLRVIDIVVIVLTLALAVALSLYTLLGKGKGEAVLIITDGAESEYSLNADRTLKVKSLTVEIKDGGVSVIASDCPDGICRACGRIDGVGQSIVCLPEGVVIRITGESKFQADTGEGL